jgi:hypothetical protein
MKNLKSVLIAAVLAVAFVSFNTASADDFKLNKKAVHVTFQKAMHVQGLIGAMYLQVDPSMLNSNQQTYSARVVLEGTTYIITGTGEQWAKFFAIKWKKKVEKPSIGLGTN